MSVYIYLVCTSFKWASSLRQKKRLKKYYYNLDNPIHVVTTVTVMSDGHIIGGQWSLWEILLCWCLCTLIPCLYIFTTLYWFFVSCHLWE